MWVENILLISFVAFVGAENIFDITKVERNDELCDLQLDYVETNFNQGALWAKIMRDSWGSFPSGIYSGNYMDFGNYDQCIRFSHSSVAHGNFHGQHCTIVFAYEPHAVDARGKFAPQRFTDDVSIGIGVCVPDSCSHDRITEIANSTLVSTRNTTILLGRYAPQLLCSVEDKGFEWNALRIIAVVLITFILILMIMSTFYEVSCNIKESKKNEIFCIFSVYSNSKIIMTMKSFSSKEMIFLHGIRALAVIWVVTGHSWAFNWRIPLMNGNDYFLWIQNFQSMFIFGGFMGVDTFFTLSAMLLTLSVFHELDKTKKINLFALYVKRYFRLTIPLAACLLLSLTFFVFISNGPLWNLFVNLALVKLCEKFWWTTILYIGNYANPGMLCFGHAWYLFIDMQLYVLSPLILYPMWKLRNKKFIVIPSIFALASVSVIFIFVAVMRNGFRVSPIDQEAAGIKEAMLYYTTHCRIDSWMMGMLTGYILHNIEGKIVKLPKKVVTLGWILCISAMLTVILSPYPLQQIDFEENPLVADASFDAFKRVAWCLSVGWIIIACQLGYGGIAKRFLSLSIWLPISKLSYGIYLTHVLIMLVNIASIRSPQYFSNFTSLYKFFGDFSMAFIFAFILALIFEYPTLRIIKILMERKNVQRVENTRV